MQTNPNGFIARQKDPDFDTIPPCATNVLAVAIGLAAGCATTPCPPGQVAGHEEESVRRYYTLPGLGHGLLQSPVNILSEETEPGRHTIELGPGDGAQQVTNRGHTVQVGFGKGLVAVTTA